MRKVSLMLVAILLLASTVGFAKAKDGIERDPSKELRVEVKKLLNSRFEMSSKEKFDATVVFTINKDREIVVLYVESVDDNFEVFVKSKLNYKTIKIDGVIEGRRYTIPVTVQS